MSIVKGLNQYGNPIDSLRKSFFDILKKQKAKFVTMALADINSIVWTTYPSRLIHSETRIETLIADDGTTIHSAFQTDPFRN
tara:strand:+ start:737 stop:982 length:246 start_codon:yes stop_codon:yes gene_type:complete